MWLCWCNWSHHHASWTLLLFCFFFFFFFFFFWKEGFSACDCERILSLSADTIFFRHILPNINVKYYLYNIFITNTTSDTIVQVCSSSMLFSVPVTKGVNFILEVVSVWPGERNISVLVDINVPFQVYCYIYFIHKYIFVLFT